MSSCPLQHSSSRRDTVTQPPSPSGNPRGLCARAFPLWESPRSHVAHLPSGNPEGILPQSPGLRRRGATLGKGQRHKQPQRGCADGSNGWHVGCVWRGYWKYIPGGLLFGTREPDSIPPFDIDPPGGHERHNPLRGRERAAACTRGSAWIGATPGFMTQRRWRWGASPAAIACSMGARALWRNAAL